MAVLNSPTLFQADPSVVGLPADGFHPAVATWFARRFPEGPTPAQEEGWAHIAAGRDTLIAAPTGSGKTLAGFLVAIDSLYRAHQASQDVEAVTRVVYVSPLKALAVDIAENLERPLAEIAAVARELGLQPAPIRVSVRTGDTSNSERSRMGLISCCSRHYVVLTDLRDVRLGFIRHPPARARIHGEALRSNLRAARLRSCRLASLPAGRNAHATCGLRAF